MTEYKQGFDTHVAFPVKVVETTLAEQVSLAGLSQAHIAETEKFPHATYFLNGGKETPHENEEHILLDSRKDVATHELAPEMRAMDIAEKAAEALQKGTDFLFINIANPDMVGHTANVPAIITALETTDKALEIIVKATLDAGGIAIVTADHGNAETNREEDGTPHTSHTYNLVPCIVTEEGISLIEQGTLADLAPTVLEYLDIKKPESMIGGSLKR
jgi:2,3-bisphosphoglycerate-independent phosphoglycerate mutase